MALARRSTRPVHDPPRPHRGRHRMGRPPHRRRIPPRADLGIATEPHEEYPMTTVPQFANKVAFVTGAGNGIGRATAIAFAREGAAIAAVDLSIDHSRETVASIEQLGGRALAIACDVTRDDDIVAALQQTVDTFGRLDIAFNNAGIALRTGAAADITDDEWDRTINTNLRGMFLC